MYHTCCCVLSQGVDQAGNVSPRPCGNMTWTVDTTAPMLSVTFPANNTVTRNATMTVMLNANEPVAGLLLLLPGASEWTKANTTVGELLLTAYGEGQQQAALKGEDSNTTGGWKSYSVVLYCRC